MAVDEDAINVTRKKYWNNTATIPHNAAILLISVKRSIMRKQTIRHKKPTQKLINSCP
jgi:hypothetical protein